MLYKYVGARSRPEALQTLRFFCEQYTLKASEPTSFNDPFEFKVVIDLEADEDTIRMRFFRDRPGASQAEYEDWRSQHTKQSKWWIAQEMRRELLSRFGVFCASPVEDNHVMWAHYAKSHTGFCVGFDESQLTELKGLIGQGSVKYQQETPIFRYYFDPPQLFGNRVFGHKSELWSYEREYRLVFDHSGLVEFPRSALKEVILGCRAYPELRTYARERFEKNNVRFFQICEDFKAYRLIKQPFEKNTSFMSSFF